MTADEINFDQENDPTQDPKYKPSYAQRAKIGSKFEPKNGAYPKVVIPIPEIENSSIDLQTKFNFYKLDKKAIDKEFSIDLEDYISS